MAGSLDGRARRVRRLEGRGLERPKPSRTEQEAWAIDAEIKEIREELRALGVDPDEWLPTDVRMDLPLDEQIAELEKEIAELEKDLDDDKRPPVVEFVDPDNAPPDEWCEKCGRALSLTIHMDWGDSGL